jgi:formate hydrogenlyase subunit 3/multisubunit Na+/H+ antiporter MnhD subunit
VLALAVADDRLPMTAGAAAALLGLAGALLVLPGGLQGELVFRLAGWRASLEVDALSAAFLLPLQIVAGLGFLYGRDYWPLDAAKGTGRWLRCSFALLAAGMTLVFTARQGVLFLLAWEFMAMSALLLIATEHERPEVRRGAWVYLACTHVGTVLLTLMVLLLAQRLGGTNWYAGGALRQPGLDAGILLLALAGFGFKAGLAPLHFWLPAAHAGTPSNGSALLSAVMLKAGVYGFLRVASLLPPVPHLGGAVMAAGGVTALYGVGCALAQRDFKRLLAYSSVENLGVVFLGVGLGLAGRAAGNPWVAALGFGAALFHVWNHAVFKSLLFLGSGALLHATGTRDLERLGGLAARMPRTALVLFPGVLAAAALPPCNGFAGEWLLYRGLFAPLARQGAWAEGLALAALAFTGGLAALAFAKFFGFAFLGEPRGPEAAAAHDPGPWMLGPMAALAGLCLALGLGAPLLLPLLDRVLAVLNPGAAPQLAAGLTWDMALLSGLSALLLLLAGAAAAWLRRSRQQATAPGVPRPGTWDCGYARPTARMQYSASSFVQGWGEHVPGLRLRARRLRPLFPKTMAVGTEFRDVVGDEQVAPGTGRLADRLLRFRSLQQGHLPVYLLYILLTLVAVFLWLIIRPRLLG